MALIRTQVRLQFATLAGEDVFVNTWHWASLGTFSEATTQPIAVALADFYGKVHPSTSAAILSFRHPYMSTTMEMRHYDLGRPEHDRVPIIDLYNFQTVTALSTTGLPEEVAICSSFYGNPNVPRRRGRHYFGPFNTNVLRGGAPAPTRVADQFQQTVKQSALTMAAPSAERAADWIVYSGKFNLQSLVVGGWIDDAFDTQRRRGIDATGRVEWGTPGLLGALLSVDPNAVAGGSEEEPEPSTG